MKISAAFPSEYLRAADLQGRQIKVCISHVEMRDVGDDHKPVVFFQNKDKGVVLNKTNSNNIAIAYGDDTDDWAGREVILYEAMVDFQGRSVPAIRIRPPNPRERGAASKATNGAKPTAPTAQHTERNPPPPTGVIEDSFGEDIPF